MDVDLAWIATATGAARARRGDRIQSLWSGYGEIIRVELSGGPHESAIVKFAKPPERDQGRSFARKCRSYDVEMAWYRGLAKQCDDACRVPTLLASKKEKDEWVFVLEDLDSAGFSGRSRDPSPTQNEACLAWLAAFHARFMNVAPDQLWKSGTYWHLQTRPDELARVRDESLRANAPILDRQLREAKFQTIVHGDAKPANFCFAPKDSAVAAVDFQYVGGGCGMKDVAYFLYDESLSPTAEARYLDFYFDRLREASCITRDELPKVAQAVALRNDIDVAALENEWRALYPVAKADFHRFLAGWSV
jgi:aminoglycoside phosphotransferase (APT) family kinase protein